MKSHKIFIHQDNAKPHGYINDVEVIAGMKEQVWDMEVINQPPNIPDLNVLDLVFFESIQSLQKEENMKDIDELVRTTIHEFYLQNRQSLDSVFLTL